MTQSDILSEPLAALTAGAPVEVPMSAPDITAAEVRAVNEVLATPNLSMGEKLETFERDFADYVGVRHAVGVNSGTSGLHLAVLAAGIHPGDYVVTTPFSFIASANCILYAGGIPIFVDVDPATGNIDPGAVGEAVDRIARALPEGKRWLPPKLRARLRRPDALRLKAVLPVHAFGQPADLDPLLATAVAYGLALIEDACEAVGATYKGRRAGTFGNAAVFAFYPNKQITTGEGGMLVTDDDHWAALFRSLRNQGRDEFNAWLNHARLGYNYRLDELSAALGLAQLGRIEELLARRAQVAQWYNQRLAASDLVQAPAVAHTTTCMSWFVYVVRINPRIDRDALIQRLKAVGIPSRPYFTPIHLQPFYREKFGYRPGDYPTAERLGDQSLALPFSSVMDEAQVDTVCQHLLRLAAEMAVGPNSR